MKHLLLFIILLNFALISQAQQKTELGKNDMFAASSDNNGNLGKVYIIQDQRIDELVNRHIEQNQRSKTIMGWRVQIFFGSGQKDREKAQDVRAEFIKSFPDIKAYLIYEAPYFKVRVGDFRTKYEALKLKKNIEIQFTNLWIVEDNINLPEL